MILSSEQTSDMLNRIQLLISEKKLSKKDFYSKSGISSSVFSQWNTGRTKPKMDSIGKIADTLGVTPEYLIYGTVKEKEPPPLQEDNNLELRETLRRRPEMKILFDTALDAPTSAIYEAIATIMKAKEGNQ